MRLFRRHRKLNVALQGGGVHGAFTWGALDRLLADRDIDVGWISGTSAGAVNAVAVAHGLAQGDRERGRQAMRDIWNAVERAGLPDLMRFNPFLAGFAKAAPIANMAALFSPYEFNPTRFDPLRKIINEHVDFAAIRSCDNIELLIAATDVATGRARLFRRPELTVDAVLASACLPTLHHAVEIDGRAYWDGGFSANPDLVTLAAESPVNDTLLIQLNPVYKAGAPRDAKGIEDRVNTITFNQPLIRDIETILLAKAMRGGLFAPRNDRLYHLKTHRFHLIEAGRHTSGLDADSKILPDTGLINYLFGAGEREAGKWLEVHKSAIGKRSSVDLKARFIDSEPVAFVADQTADGVVETVDTRAGPIVAKVRS